MKSINISLCTPDDFILGIYRGKGEDEYGSFDVFSIGFLFFEIAFYTYE